MTEQPLVDKIREAHSTIARRYFSRGADTFDVFAFEISEEGTVIWLEFYGTKEEMPDDGYITMTREIFRSVCLLNGVIFIDSSSLAE